MAQRFNPEPAEPERRRVSHRGKDWGQRALGGILGLGKRNAGLCAARRYHRGSIGLDGIAPARRRACSARPELTTTSGSRRTKSASHSSMPRVTTLMSGCLDSVRGVTPRLTSDPAIDDPPMWSPDGLRVVWASNRSGAFDLYVKSANRAGPEQLLVPMGAPTGGRKTGRRTAASSSTRFRARKPDRIYGSLRSRQQGESGDRKPFPYLQTGFDERHGRFSPDGRWVAYTSNESGREEVYVQSFPASGAGLQISTGGGMEPQWRKDGTELFYISEDRTLIAVPVKLAVRFRKRFRWASRSACFQCRCWILSLLGAATK